MVHRRISRHSPPSISPLIMSSRSMKFTLEDGASLSYEILGPHHIGTRTPLVFVNGIASLKTDWGRLPSTLAEQRTGLYLTRTIVSVSSWILIFSPSLAL